jgi:hypothetical protein
MVVSYLLGSELAFLREARYLVNLKEYVVDIFVLREISDSLCVGSLTVAPEHRRYGIASFIFGSRSRVANRLGRNWLAPGYCIEKGHACTSTL